MLSPFDDYLCHQTLDAIEFPVTADQRFYSRYFITVYDNRGEFALITALANYQNSRVQDGFALLGIGDAEQRNLRVSRRLRHDAHVLSTGPVGIEILEPMRRFRITCAENDLGFSYDIVCDTTTPAWERRQRFGSRVNGRVNDIGCHFNQGYRCQGTLTVDGITHKITPDRWFGVRDRSWGIGRFWDGEPSPAAAHAFGHVARREEHYMAPTTVILDRGPFGAGPNPVGGRFGHHNSWVPFVGQHGEDVYLAVSFRPHVYTIGGAIMYPWGDTRQPTMLLAMERTEVTLDEDGEVRQCAFTYYDENGAGHDMTARRLMKVYEAGAGYADMGTGFQMGCPTGGVEPLVEGERFSMGEFGRFLEGRSVLGASSTSIGFHVCEYRWGDFVGYGSFEADQNEMAELPFARYEPPTVRNGRPSEAERTDAACH